MDAEWGEWRGERTARCVFVGERELLRLAARASKQPTNKQASNTSFGSAQPTQPKGQAKQGQEVSRSPNPFIPSSNRTLGPSTWSMFGIGGCCERARRRRHHEGPCRLSDDSCDGARSTTRHRARTRHEAGQHASTDTRRRRRRTRRGDSRAFQGVGIELAISCGPGSIIIPY